MDRERDERIGATAESKKSRTRFGTYGSNKRRKTSTTFDFIYGEALYGEREGL